ncbi:MAG TPA: CotH kinase family protein [Solirubrobacterales bacterium]
MAGSTRLGRATAFACGLLCLLAAAPSAQGDEDPAAPMFRPDTIDVIDLQLPPESFKTLEDEPEDHYVEGTFSLAETDGTPGGVGPFSMPITVGIRLKGGNGSFRDLKDKKAAFKIKFNQVKGQKFLGLKKLTLNNMVQDASMLHETMAYEAFRALGVPAPRTGYANVYVNGVNYGVHLNVETYDDVSLPHWFATTQHLYEADEPGVDVRPESQGEFEVDEGDEEDRGDLKALIAAANSGATDWSGGMATTADLGEMTRMWAVERYTGHWDGYAGVALPHIPPVRPNNYFLHSDEAGLFSMLPWGTDQTWGLDVEFDEPAGGLLFNNCLADASCKGQYVHALRELQGVVDGLDLGVQAGCLAERLAPWQAIEDGERREYDAEEIAEGVEAAEDFIAARPAELSDWLATQPAGGGGATAAPAPCGSPEPEPAPEPEAEAKTDPGAMADQGGSSLPAASSLADPPSSGPTPGEDIGSALRLLRLVAGGGELQARLRLGDSGRLTVMATLRTPAGVRRVCASHYEAKAPGGLTLRCSLSSLAREHLRTRQLTLQVTVRFQPGAGKAVTIRRALVLPRLG